MIDLLLSIGFVRNKLLFHLKHKYFHELGHSISLQSGYWAHLLEKDSYDSFSEIFIKQEYLEFIPDEPISRILDIGASYGYFSLWLQSKHPEIELTSLMIEPSPSCARSLRNLVNQKKLDGRFSYLQKSVGHPGSESSFFYDRPHMAGSRYFLSKSEKAIQVQNLCEADIVKRLQPPYDLIKCDIEGSEWEFLNNFQNLIRESKYLLLEWHSWHEGGGGLPQIEKSMHSLDFCMVRSSKSVPAIAKEGEVGLVLFKNTANV
jgi:FkbM family methyltransferase